MIIRTFLAVGLTIATGCAVARGNIEAGKQKAQTCAACHGPDGNGIGITMYPVLAGQHVDYLSKALHDYKSGARNNVIMAGFAGTLSEQDIADLTAYFAAQKGPLTELHVPPTNVANQ